MTNIISFTIKQSLVDEIDKIRKDYNLKRSKFICKILDYVCNDEKLLQDIFNNNNNNITKKDGIK